MLLTLLVGFLGYGRLVAFPNAVHLNIQIVTKGVLFKRIPPSIDSKNSKAIDHRQNPPNGHFKISVIRSPKAIESRIEV